MAGLAVEEEAEVLDLRGETVGRGWRAGVGLGDGGGAAGLWRGGGNGEGGVDWFLVGELRGVRWEHMLERVRVYFFCGGCFGVGGGAREEERGGCRADEEGGGPRLQD